MHVWSCQSQPQVQNNVTWQSSSSLAAAAAAAAFIHIKIEHDVFDMQLGPAATLAGITESRRRVVPVWRPEAPLSLESRPRHRTNSSHPSIRPSIRVYCRYI